MKVRLYILLISVMLFLSSCAGINKNTTSRSDNANDIQKKRSLAQAENHIIDYSSDSLECIEPKGLAEELVMRIVMSRRSSFTACIERWTPYQDTPSEAFYELYITPEGKVGYMKVRFSKAPNASNDCIVSQFKKMRFPKATNGNFTVYHIKIESGPSEAKIGLPLPYLYNCRTKGQEEMAD